MLANFKYLILLITGLTPNLLFKIFAQQNITLNDSILIYESTIKRLQDLNSYLATITSKDASNSSKDFAIKSALALFLNEDCIVQVSSKKKDNILSFKIESYLKRIRLLQYSKIVINWYEIYVSKNFIKGPDGRYYGSASIMQEFIGYNSDRISYADKTKKTVEIVVEKLRKADEEIWYIYFGNILVEETW